MHTLRALLRQIKPATDTERFLLKVIECLCRVIEKDQVDERNWGPANQAISEAKKILETK